MRPSFIVKAFADSFFHRLHEKSSRRTCVTPSNKIVRRISEICAATCRTVSNMISDISSIPDKIRIKFLTNYLVAMIAKKEICNLHYLLRIQEIMKVLFFDIEIEISGQQLVALSSSPTFPTRISGRWPLPASSPMR